MSKRKPIDKEQARERRNRLLDSASAARLSLTEGVREMRAIAGMTQEEFARHREVSARVIKAIELGQGNPTVATLNRIGRFFGLEVGFVPVKRQAAADGWPHQATSLPPTPAPPGLSDTGSLGANMWSRKDYQEFAQILARELMQNSLDAVVVKNQSPETLADLDARLAREEPLKSRDKDLAGPGAADKAKQARAPGKSAPGEAPAVKKKRPRSP